VPISEKTLDYGRELLASLKAAGIRASLDEHNDKLGAKIRRAEIEKVPYTLVLGGKEAETRSVSIRSRSKGDEGTVAFDQFLPRVQEEIRLRSLSEKRKPA
jgi:threonyl-tRNA synthetase